MTAPENNKVAVLLATYNGFKWLPAQLESICLQKDINVDIFISDDGSTDGTQQWLQHNQADFEYSLLPNKRSGNAAANFFRLLRETDFSDYDYVALSDQDDIWLPDKLSRAIESLHANGCAGYSSNIMAFWPDHRQKLIEKAQPQQKYDFMFESAGPGCTFVLTQRLALALQAFLRTHMQDCQEIALHDWFFYAFARSRGYTWYIDPAATLLYRQHANNAFGANSGIQAIKARLAKLKQGWYLEQIVQIAKTLGYERTVIIQRILRLNWFDRLQLACCAYQYRRRLRDRLAFAFYILFLAHGV